MSSVYLHEGGLFFSFFLLFLGGGSFMLLSLCFRFVPGGPIRSWKSDKHTRLHCLCTILYMFLFIADPFSRLIYNSPTVDMLFCLQMTSQHLISQISGVSLQPIPGRSKHPKPWVTPRSWATSKVKATADGVGLTTSLASLHSRIFVGRLGHF